MVVVVVAVVGGAFVLVVVVAAVVVLARGNTSTAGELNIFCKHLKTVERGTNPAFTRQSVPPDPQHVNIFHIHKHKGATKLLVNKTILYKTRTQQNSIEGNHRYSLSLNS